MGYYVAQVCIAVCLHCIEPDLCARSVFACKLCAHLFSALFAEKEENSETILIPGRVKQTTTLCHFCLLAGNAVALSHDHKPMNDEEKQRIEAAGGTVSHAGGVPRVNGNLNLSRAIGDLKYKTNKDLPVEAQIITAHPDVRVFELSSEDQFFLLACDGVWDVLSNEV